MACTFINLINYYAVQTENKSFQYSFKLFLYLIYFLDAPCQSSFPFITLYLHIIRLIFYFISPTTSVSENLLYITRHLNILR